MKIVLTIDTSHVPFEREDDVAQTIAADVAYMLNEKHEDVYRTLTMFLETEMTHI